MGEMDMGDLPGTPSEADTATAEGEQVSREEWAEQRRADARAPLEPPTHFSTPAWLGPSSREYVAPQVPEQPEPVHDHLSVYAPTPAAMPDNVPDSAHWVEHRKPRIFVGLLMVAALAGAVVSLVLAIVNQSIVAGAGLVVCGVVAVIFRSALVSSGLTTVDLKNSTLKVRKDGEQSIFNLADPALRVEETGTPGSSDWKVVLESVHHHELTLTAANVTPSEFHEVISYYRSVAERERQERFNRFNR